VGAFQLRLKDASDEAIRAAARAILPVTYRHGVAFILNDRVDLVDELGADGVHLGQDDMPCAKARQALSDDKIIGISCHDSAHLAMEAGEAGADYVAFGAFYPTRSKSPDKLARYGTPTQAILENWAATTTVPAVAIGGMTPENCVDLVTAGADFIAAITAVWEHVNGPAAAVAAFNAAIKKGLQARSAV
jgi:thiamine-phosphate pyrophosphorylase